MSSVIDVTKHIPAGKLFVNGSLKESTGNARIRVVNPATGNLLASVPDASLEDVDAAVAAARASFEDKRWRGKDPSEKEAILWRWADILESHKQELAAI